MESKAVCLTHMTLVESCGTAWQIQHNLSICEVKPGQDAASQLGCLLPALRDKLETERTARNQQNASACDVCGKPGFLLKFSTFRTFCENCYPEPAANTISLSGLDSASLQRLFTQLLPLHCQEFGVTFAENLTLSSLQVAVRRAGPLKSDFVCAECGEQLTAGMPQVVVRHSTGSFHYCAVCFGQKNTSSLFTGAISVEGMSAVLNFPSHPKIVFHEVMTVEFPHTSSLAYCSTKVQSSHGVRLDTLVVRTANPVRNIWINKWRATFQAYRKDSDLLCLVLDYEVPVPYGEMDIEIEAEAQVFAGGELGIGRDGTIWRQSGGLLCSVTYYCFRTT